MSPRARKHLRDITVTFTVDDPRYGIDKRLVVRSTFPYDWDHPYAVNYQTLDGTTPRSAQPISFYLAGPITARVEERPDAKEVRQALRDEAARIVRAEGVG